MSSIPGRLAGCLVYAALALHSITVHAAAPRIEVELEGVTGELADNIRAYLSVLRYSNREDLSEPLVRRLHRRAPQDVRDALRAFGYYEPRIESELQAIEQGWRARYRIDPGPPTLLETVTVMVVGPGGDDRGFTELVDAARLIPGERLEHARYERLKNELLSLALRRGYLDAHFNRQELRVDPRARRAAIQLEFATGPRYRFGDIRIDQDVLEESFMRRLVGLREGDFYDTRDLLNAEYALYDSGYFSVVELETEREEASAAAVPISIRVEGRAPNRWSFGVGYGTDTRFRGTIGWENRRVNRRGHRMRAELKISQVGQDLRYRYIVPIGKPARERLSFTAALINEEEIGDATSRRIELGTTETRVLGDWQRNLFVLLNRETSELATEQRTDTLLIPGINFSRTEIAADRLSLSSKLFAELRGSHAALGSDTEFAQLRLQAGLVVPAGERSRLVLRSEFGASWVDQFSELPASQRFFAGGDRSVRGFGYNELSPRNEDGERVGGRHLIFGSVEFQRDLAGRWGAAIFVDGGNAINTLDEELEYSVGLGVRWRSPVGPVRLDIAKPVSDSSGPRLHLSVGPEL